MLAMEDSHEFEDLSMTLNNLSSADEESDDNDTVVTPKDEVVSEKKPSQKRKRDVVNTKEIELDHILFGNKEGLISNLRGFSTDVIDQEATPKQIKSAWHDSDDEENSEEASVSKSKLKKKFERIAGTPKWADPKTKKSEDSDEEISRSVGHLTQSTSYLLPKTTLNVKKLRDVNRATGNEGEITSVIFHPKSTVGIVAGMKGIVSMFSIDSDENKKIHSMQFEKFKIFCCKLNNAGDELILGSNVSHYHTYDLLTGNKQRLRVPKTMTNLKLFQFSPCGKYIAVVGQFGEVHLINSITKELICSMKQEYQCTSISFSGDSTKLLCHSDDTEITIFDLRMQRIVNKFEDDGCVNGSYVSVSPNGKLIAAGSRQGVVNIYNYDDVYEKKRPKPQKTVFNLTTEITDVQFNPSSEMLAICSKEMKNAVKFVHFPSATVFSNFPSNQEQLGKPTVMAFSPAGGFFAIGNLQSKVPLYRIRHYNNY